jgi:hypothetical protein
MQTRTRYFGWIGAIVVTGLLALSPGGAAHAAPPTIQHVTVDLTLVAGRLTDACGFPVQVHSVADYVIHSWYDANGNLRKEIDNAQGTDTYFANGHSAVGRDGGVEQDIYHADGSLTVLIAGPDRFVVLPGGGPVWGRTGTIRMEIDANGTVTSITGLDAFGNYGPLCTALAP